MSPVLISCFFPNPFWGGRIHAWSSWVRGHRRGGASREIPGGRSRCHRSEIDLRTLPWPPDFAPTVSPHERNGSRVSTSPKATFRAVCLLRITSNVLRPVDARTLGYLGGGMTSSLHPQVCPHACLPSEVHGHGCSFISHAYLFPITPPPPPRPILSDLPAVDLDHRRPTGSIYLLRGGWLVADE